MLDSALHPVALAIGFRRGNSVVVGCPRLEPVYAHAENGIGMALVQPDWRFRRLVQFRRIRTVAHNAVMLGRTARVVAGPPDNRKIVISPFDLWPLRDPDVRGSICRWTHLRGRWS